MKTDAVSEIVPDMSRHPIVDLVESRMPQKKLTDYLKLKELGEDVYEHLNLCQ
ncbi:MAG: hypothetical protein OXI87_22405 [Albidovulum sp.]|nr:hypothetical protein [Albidovulum sp.]MDE0531537.1 hypothetical protein [Albidovulum sp.]